MRILHLIASKGFYGAENVVLQLAAAQVAVGHQPSIGLIHYASQTGNPLLEKAKCCGVGTLDLPCAGRLDLSLLRRLRRALTNECIDVLHTHNYKSNTYGYLAARALPVATIATCHNWTDTTAALRLYGRFDRRLLTLFDHVVTVAAEPAERLQRAGLSAKRVSIIENGVTLQPTASGSAASPGNQIRIGAVTRLSPEKGVDVLICAVALCRKLHPPTGNRMRVLIVGDGPERAALEALIASLKLEEVVELRGFTSDVPAFLSSLDIFAQPSRKDAMPMSVLEAMAVGLPVVASSLGQIPAMLAAGQRGVLVPAENTRALAVALLNLATDLSRRCALGNAARDYVRTHLSAAAMESRYRDVYQRCLQTPAAIRADVQV